MNILKSTSERSKTIILKYDNGRSIVFRRMELFGYYTDGLTCRFYEQFLKVDQRTPYKENVKFYEDVDRFNSAIERAQKKAISKTVLDD